MKSLSFKSFLIINFIILNSLIYSVQAAANKTRVVVSVCDRQPTINGLCGSSTLGIYYDAETKRCKYLGCSPDKKIFSSLEDCERRCNKKRRHRRVRYSKV